MRTNVIKLPHGAVLIHTRNNINKEVNVQVVFSVGSANTEYKPGLLHFGEHLRGQWIKGMKREELLEDYAKKGISFGAGTSKKSLLFAKNTHKKFINEAFSRLVETMIFDSPTKEEFEKEKEIIISEINNTKANVNRQFLEKLNGKVYLDKFRNTNGLGEKKDIIKYTNRQVQNHISKIINSNNLVVGISGNISLWHAKYLVKKYLISSIPHDTPQIKQLDINPIFAEKRKLILSKNENEANSVLILIPTKIINNKDLRQRFQISYIISLLGGVNGDIFKELRFKNGLVYSSEIFSQDSTKSIYVRFQTKKENINKAISLVADIFNKAQITPLKKKEIDERDKITEEMAYRKSNFFLNNDNIENYMFYGKQNKSKVSEKIIKKMTADEINAKIKDIMTNNKVYVLVEGNAEKKDVMPISKIEKLFFPSVTQK